MGGKLPSGRAYASAVWTGTLFYLFGGEDASGRYDAIVRYDPAADSASATGSTLPARRSGTSAVWDGTNAYVFGGFDGGVFDSIVRFTPSSGAVTTLGSRLPGARYDTSAVWTGTHAFVFGGFGGADLDQIVRFNPSNGEVRTMGARLPFGRAATSAVWDGTYAYVFGGTYNGGSGYVSTDEIVRYHPASDSVRVMISKLPTGRFLMGVAWSGSHAYLLGGVNHLYGSYDQILRYDPSGDSIEALAIKLPTKREGPSAAWGSGGAYSLGGALFRSGGWVYLDEVVRVTIDPPSAPLGLTAASARGEIRLAWTAPASPGSFAITGYGVYAGDSSTSLSLVADLGNVLAWTEPGLADGVTRYYRVAAENAIGEGARSNEAAATTLAPPSAPRSLVAATGTSPGRIRLDWQAPASPGTTAITAYRVYRGEAAGAETLLAQLSNVHAYADTGLPEGAVRYYRVSAVNSIGEGSLSPSASARAPARPTEPRNLDAEPGPSLSKITLTWDAPADDGGLGLSQYRIYRGEDAEDEELVATIAATTTTWTDASLPILQTFTYRVSASNAVGEGPKSESACSHSYPWHLVPSTPATPACRPLADARG